MAIDCAITLRWDLRPDQLRALGSALWTWCLHAAGGGSIYQYLDNQALADLVDGRFPSSEGKVGNARLPYIFFTVPEDPARDRYATCESLRLAFSSEGIADLRIGGTSWRAAGDRP
jgi:hypothetical protein